MENLIHVTTEIGKLKRLLIHSPDAGIGKVVPRMKEQLLYDDIVYLEQMQVEYDEFFKVLLCFLDPEKIKGKGNEPAYRKAWQNHTIYSENVIDFELILTKVLEKEKVRNLLVPSVCAIERCGLEIQEQLLSTPPDQLAYILITGILSEEDGKEKYVFAPIPNLIFTRDIGITIHDHLLLNKPFEKARERESLLFRYIAHYELLGNEDNILAHRVIELKERDLFFAASEEKKELKAVTIEGGDIMMISPGHLIVGLSERTSVTAIDKLTETLFDRNLVQKVSVVRIPQKRTYMHIDTVFTQIKRDMWILFSPFSQQEIEGRIKNFDFAGNLSAKHSEPVYRVEVTQFHRVPDPTGRYTVNVKKLPYLDNLLQQISQEDFKMEHCDIILCAGGVFPYSEREQWTDACNFLAIREGVVIGYDRNIKTEEEFRKRGFNVIKSGDLIGAVESGQDVDEIVQGDTLILLPSSELSRARGGTHCMSLPLLREDI